LFKVVFTRKCSQEIVLLKKEGVLSEEDLLVIRAWVQEMGSFGPDYIKGCGYWNDHPLREKRAGERSSSFSESGRIIYRVAGDKILIRVLKVTAKHEY
jgi:hypothetical protein